MQPFRLWDVAVSGVEFLGVNHSPELLVLVNLFGIGWMKVHRGKEDRRRAAAAVGMHDEFTVKNKQNRKSIEGFGDRTGPASDVVRGEGEAEIFACNYSRSAYVPVTTTSLSP